MSEFNFKSFIILETIDLESEESKIVKLLVKPISEASFLKILEKQLWKVPIRQVERFFLHKPSILSCISDAALFVNVKAIIL